MLVNVFLFLFQVHLAPEGQKGRGDPRGPLARLARRETKATRDLRGLEDLQERWVLRGNRVCQG